MSLTCLAPREFIGYDIVLELMFGLIALAISLFAYKAYKFTNSKQIGYFSLGFGFISLAYYTQAIFSAIILRRGGEIACNIQLIETLFLNTMGFYAYILLMTIGLVILVYMTFKKTKIKVLWFMLTTTIIGMMLTHNAYYTFYTYTILFFGFLSWHFIENYLKNRQNKTLLVASAFILLLISSLLFLLNVNYQGYYTIGKLFELFAYMLIMINFYLIIKN